MIETAVVAIAIDVAVVAVADDVARASLDESSTIGASEIDCSRAVRFG